MTRSVTAERRLTPDITVGAWSLTPLQYKKHLELLKDVKKGLTHRWLGKDMTDLEHEVWIAVHQQGLVKQDRDFFHRLTPYGELYLSQRETSRDPKTRRSSNKRDPGSAYSYGAAARAAEAKSRQAMRAERERKKRGSVFVETAHLKASEAHHQAFKAAQRENREKESRIHREKRDKHAARAVDLALSRQSIRDPHSRDPGEAPMSSKFQDVPLAKVVLRGGGRGRRKGTRVPYQATAYDVNGHMRSRVTDLDRAYVDRKIAEWWPGVPVEDETGGAVVRVNVSPVKRDKSFREKSRAWFQRAPLDRDAALIAKAFLELGPKDAQTLFVHTVKQKQLAHAETVALKERVWQIVKKQQPEQGRKAPKKSKVTKTFQQARREILQTLLDAGWKLSSVDLKVPHATSPSGRLRLWFRPQAVWFSEGSHHELGRAHTVSYDLDIRQMSGKSFLERILRAFPEAR